MLTAFELSRIAYILQNINFNKEQMNSCKLMIKGPSVFVLNFMCSARRAKKSMPDSQRYPLNLNLINNVKDNVDNLTGKFISLHFFRDFTRNKCASRVWRENTIKNSLNKQKLAWISHLIRQCEVPT